MAFSFTRIDGLQRLFRRVAKWLTDAPPRHSPTGSVPPMNIFQTLEHIVHRLREAGGTASADWLADRVDAFGTAGEVLDSSCSLLLGLKQRQPTLYAVIREPAEELLAYAHRIGYGPFFATYPEPQQSPPENKDSL